jgi:hypothetical protein
MRAREFINESKHEREPHPDIYDTLPHSYALPELKNQDAYRQYRFGVLVAGHRGKEQRKKDGVSSLSAESEWGENEIVIGYGVELDGYIDAAMSTMGLSKKIKTSSKKSVEPSHIDKSSPITPFKGYK